MFRSTAASAFLLASFVALPGARAQERPVSQLESPPTRIYHSLVFIDELGGLLLTGGHSSLGWEADLRDMWIWQGAGGWQPFGVYEASPSPSARSGGEEAQAPAYDKQSGQLVVLNSFGETWAFDVSKRSWKQFETSSAPRTRCGQGLAYDEESHRIILFGGFDCMSPNDPALDETWAFDVEAGEWERMSPPVSPSPRMYFGMAYHRSLDRVVLWGGRMLEPLSDKQVWLYDYDTDTWEAVSPKGGPDQVLAYPGMVYRPEMEDLLLFGGAFLSEPFVGELRNETWRLDLGRGSWEIQEPETLPPPVAVHAFGYDPVRRTAVAFGGEVGKMYSNELFSGTWVYESATGTWIKR